MSEMCITHHDHRMVCRLCMHGTNWHTYRWCCHSVPLIIEEILLIIQETMIFLFKKSICLCVVIGFVMIRCWIHCGLEVIIWCNCWRKLCFWAMFPVWQHTFASSGALMQWGTETGSSDAFVCLVTKHWCCLVVVYIYIYIYIYTYVYLNDDKRYTYTWRHTHVF